MTIRMLCVCLASSLLLMPSLILAQIMAKIETSQWDQVTAAYEAEACAVGPSAAIVKDAEASGGKAVAALMGQGRAGHILKGGWVPCRPDAAYEVAVRLKLDVRLVAPPDIAMPLYIGTEAKAPSVIFGYPLRIEAIYRPADAPEKLSVVQWVFVTTPDMNTFKTYRDYSLRFERPPAGEVGFRVYWYGRAFASAWIDSVKVRELPLPSEADQLKAVNIPPLTISHAAPRTLAVLGVYHWTYRVPEIVVGACDAVWALPDDPKVFEKYDTIVLANVGMTWWSPLQKKLLAEFVKAGGGLIILGGQESFGKSAVHASPLLADLLPVKTAGLWDLRKASAAAWTLRPAGGNRFAGLAWKDGPAVCYRHEAVPKPDAQVWLTLQEAGGKADAELPALVVRSYGKGLVAAFLLTPLGRPEGKAAPFWKWKDWGRLLNLTLNAVRGRQGEEGIEPPGYKPAVVELSLRPPPPPPQKIETYPKPIVTPGTNVAILRVWPARIRYLPGERATGTITVGNGTKTAAKVTLSVSLVAGLEEVHPLSSQTLELPAGVVKDVSVAWEVGQREFGQELRAELKAGDGSLLDRKGEYFTVGWNSFRLGQGRIGQTWTWDSGTNQLPQITPEDRWNKLIPDLRERYCTLTEYFAWAPDMFGNLTPDKKEWFTGESLYLISQADIRAVIGAAHSQGIAVTTYGKKWMGVSGAQSDCRDGVELIREHPEWCEWTAAGHPKYWFDVSKYLWSFEQWRDYVQKCGKADNMAAGIIVNCYPEECVRYGCEEILRSAEKFGFDGVRFDDHFTLDSVFDGGLGFDGETTYRGEDYEALTVRNNRMTRELMRAARPHFLIGFNYGGTYAAWGVRQPAAFVETCKDGQFVMIEHSRWWYNNKTWEGVATLMAQENHRVAAFGGVPGYFSFDWDMPQSKRWESAMVYASQGHYYNLPNGTEPYTRFMLRYGELLYDARTRFVEKADSVLTVTPSDRVLYRPYVHRRTLDPDREQIVVSFINSPGDVVVVQDVKLPVPPVEGVTARFVVPDGWSVAGTWLLNPDDDSCRKLDTRPKDGALVVAIPKLDVWNIVVVELTRAR